MTPTFPVAAVSRLRMATDGDGVTTLVCAWGCPLRCTYCLNKFTWDENTKVDWLTAEELYARVKLDSLYFEATEGGITFGGGEHLLYADFFPEFRQVCGSKWKMNAETSLAVPRANIVLAAGTLDSFIVDIKDTDPEIYRNYTGKENDLVLSNLAYLLSLVGSERIFVRLPRIPEYNDDKARQNSKRLLLEMGLTSRGDSVRIPLAVGQTY